MKKKSCKTLILIQSNEYYAFGLQTANSWTRDNNIANNFLANGGTELNATSSLYDLEFRNYDPVLGRMHQVDPMAGKYSSLTPYNYSFNSPVMFTDVNGADPDSEYYKGKKKPLPSDMDTGASSGPNGFLNLFRKMNPFSGAEAIGPESGNHWSDGISYSDWSLIGGSQTFRDAKAEGAIVIGGQQYFIGENGERRAAVVDGQLVKWEPHNYTQWDYFLDGSGNIRRTATAVVSGKYVTIDKQSSGNGSGGLWGSTFAFAGTAAAVDGPLPIGDIVAAGAIVGVGIYSLYKELKPGYGDPKKWTYTVPDPTRQTRSYTSPGNNRFPNGSGPDWMKGILYAAGLADLANRFSNTSSWNLGGLGSTVNNAIDQTGSFFNDVKNTTLQGIYDVNNWFSPK